MGFKIISKTVLTKWIDGLCTNYRVIGPRRKQDEYMFDEVCSATDVELDYPTTILPPKKALAPQREEIFSFKGDGGGLKPSLDSQPTVLLGVHTCDMHAIALLDRTFGQGYADQHYLTRRKNTTLVSIECLKPCMEHSFCKDMGTLSVPEEFDLHLTALGDEYAVDVGSEKGSALIKGLKGIREASAEDYNLVNQVMNEKWPCFTHRLKADVTELPSLLQVGYKSTVWDEIGERCLGCASCTLVCPTCYCFNVKDEVDFSLRAGDRTRIWDSCQLDLFAVVAGGHDFRAGHASRLRHRFSRKYKYLTDAYGLVGCVGCGRCGKSCIVHITPIDTLNALKQKVQTPMES